jgi:hypothetical protein
MIESVFRKILFEREIDFLITTRSDKPRILIKGIDFYSYNLNMRIIFTNLASMKHHLVSRGVS